MTFIYKLVFLISLTDHQLIKCQEIRVLTIHSNVANHIKNLNFIFPESGAMVDNEVNGMMNDDRRVACKDELLNSVTFHLQSVSIAKGDPLMGTLFNAVPSNSEHPTRRVAFTMKFNDGHAKTVEVNAISCWFIKSIEWLLIPWNNSYVDPYYLVVKHKPPDTSLSRKSLVIQVELYGLMQHIMSYLQDSDDVEHYERSLLYAQRDNERGKKSSIDLCKRFNSDQQLNICVIAYTSYKTKTSSERDLLTTRRTVAETSSNTCYQGKLKIRGEEKIIPIFSCQIIPDWGQAAERISVTPDPSCFESLFIVKNKVDGDLKGEYELLAHLTTYPALRLYYGKGIYDDDDQPKREACALM